MRYFVTEYVYRVVLVEVGKRIRSGKQKADSGENAEDRLRATVHALAQQVPIALASTGHADLIEAVRQVLEDARFIAGLDN